MNGELITFEGINGGGKSTMMNALEKYLRAYGFDKEPHLRAPGLTGEIMVTRQPGGSSIGEFVRSVAFLEDTPRDAASLLIQADRLMHVHEVIRPALERGAVVLCDRYVDSTTAYQVYGMGWPVDFVAHLNKMATDGLMPDKTILLDISPELSLQRDKKSSRYFNEAEQITKLTQIRAGYNQMSIKGSRWEVIDATLEPLEVLARIVNSLEGILGVEWEYNRAIRNEVLG